MKAWQTHRDWDFNAHKIYLSITLTDSHEILQSFLFTDVTLEWNEENVQSYWSVTRGEPVP